MRKLEPSVLCLLAVVVVALLLRLVTAVTTVDIPGDGPTRAIDAYEWSRRPFLPTWGWWPPGFLFLSGVASVLIPQPALAGRFVNLALGTLTIPVLFLLVRRAFDTSAALFGAAALAFFPLHVELSASSLTEAAFTFEVLFGLLCMTLAVGERINPLALALSLASLCWASMTRYEAWWLLPLFPLYVLWRSRSLRIALLVAVVLAIFPCAWTIGNMRAVGDPLLGLTITTKGGVLEGVQAGTPLTALRTLAGLSVAELGALLTPLLLVGIVGAVRAGFGGPPPERLLYLTVAGMFWAPMCYVAMVRGTSLFSRYLLLGYALALPWIVLPFRPLLRRRPWTAGGLLLTMTVVSFALTGRYVAPKWVTHRQPAEIQALATWLEKSADPDAFFLLTDMEWDASYLALYWPDVSSRRSIVSAWMEDYELKRFLHERRPSLLITRESDREQRARIAVFLGADPSTAPLLHTIGTIHIYDIRGLVAAAAGPDRAHVITP